MSFDEMRINHRNAIEQFEKIALVQFTIGQLSDIYGRLKSIKIETTYECVLEIEVLTAAFVVFYARLFNRSTGSTKLSKDAIPEKLRAIHDEIMSLRDERYAHNGGHHSLNPNFTYRIEGNRVLIQESIIASMTLGAPEHWQSILDWLLEHHTSLRQQRIEHLQKLTSHTWVNEPVKGSF